MKLTAELLESIRTSGVAAAAEAASTTPGAVRAALSRRGIRLRKPFDAAAALKLHSAGLDDTAAARKLGVHRLTFRRWRQKLGLEFIDGRWRSGKCRGVTE